MIAMDKMIVDRYNAQITYLMLSVAEDAPIHLLKNFVYRLNGMSGYFTVEYQRLHESAKDFYMIIDVRSLNNDVAGYQKLVALIHAEWNKESFSVSFNDDFKRWVNEHKEEGEYEHKE